MRVVALLLAALALLAVPAAAARKQGSLFQRVTRALQDVGSALAGGVGVDPSAGAAGAAMGEAAEAAASMADGQQKAGPGVDTWATDGVLKMAMQAFKGGQFGVLRQLGQAEELKELWSQPEGVRALLDNFTLFRGIKKMAAIADKEGPLTPEDVSMCGGQTIDVLGWGISHANRMVAVDDDVIMGNACCPLQPTDTRRRHTHIRTHKQGLAALGAFREYIQASATALEGVLDPGKFAEKIYTYQTTKEPALRALFERVEAGDVEAVFALQEELVKREMGDSE